MPQGTQLFCCHEGVRFPCDRIFPPIFFSYFFLPIRQRSCAKNVRSKPCPILAHWRIKKKCRHLTCFPRLPFQFQTPQLKQLGRSEKESPIDELCNGFGQNYGEWTILAIRESSCELPWFLTNKSRTVKYALLNDPLFCLYDDQQMSGETGFAARGHGKKNTAALISRGHQYGNTMVLCFVFEFVLTPLFKLHWLLHKIVGVCKEKERLSHPWK